MDYLSMGSRLLVFRCLLKRATGVSLPGGPALFLLLCPTAFAGDFRLDVHLASKHFVEAPESIGGWSESNYGIGIEYQITNNWHLSFGAYQNSLGSRKFSCSDSESVCHWKPTPKTSYYTLAGRALLMRQNYSIGLEAGIASGYGEWIGNNGMHYDNQIISSDYLLMAGPYIRIGAKNALKIRYAFTILTAGYQYEFH